MFIALGPNMLERVSIPGNWDVSYVTYNAFSSTCIEKFDKVSIIDLKFIIALGWNKAQFVLEQQLTFSHRWGG